MTDKKPTKPKTGTIVKTRDGRWQPVITLEDGSRKRLKPFPPGTSEDYARERAQFWAEKSVERGMRRKVKPDAPIDSKSNNDAWFASWIADREAKGHTSLADNHAHYRHHIEPNFCSKHIREWTREDMRKLCRELDVKIEKGELASKSARNVWATATRMARDAAESKIDAIRVRADNPADKVEGPERGEDKGRQFLYPSEFLQFVTCEAVELEWRELVALAIYLYPRDGEFRALQPQDANLRHLNVHINKALNRRNGEVTSTKGLRNRYVPIEETLMPLLKRLVERAGDGGVLLKLPSYRDMARGLRRRLKRAGVNRRELHEGTPTTSPITFHDLRATGITWMAIRGDDPLKIQRRAGHRDLETTQRYIRLAEDIRNGFGAPFPPLPRVLTGGVSIAESITRTNRAEIWRGGRDSKTSRRDVGQW